MHVMLCRCLHSLLFTSLCSQEEERKFKERTKFGKKPRYGTVGDTIMVKGDDGLLEED
jgi:hypothetical protein